MKISHEVHSHPHRFSFISELWSSIIMLFSRVSYYQNVLDIFFFRVGSFNIYIVDSPPSYNVESFTWVAKK